MTITMVYDRLHAIWLVNQMALRHKFAPSRIQLASFPDSMVSLEYHSLIIRDSSMILDKEWIGIEFRNPDKAEHTTGEYFWTRYDGWLINGIQPYRRAMDAGMPLHTCESLVHLTHKTSKEVIPVSLVWSISDSDGLTIWMAEENDTGFPVNFADYGTTDEEQTEALCAMGSTWQTWEESFDGDY